MMGDNYVIGEGMYEDAEQWAKLPDGRIVPRGYERPYERPHGACVFLAFVGLLATVCSLGYVGWVIGLALAIFGSR